MYTFKERQKYNENERAVANTKKYKNLTKTHHHHNATASKKIDTTTTRHMSFAGREEEKFHFNFSKICMFSRLGRHGAQPNCIRLFLSHSILEYYAHRRTYTYKLVGHI